jgi:hypothetical protein
MTTYHTCPMGYIRRLAGVTKTKPTASVPNQIRWAEMSITIIIPTLPPLLLEKIKLQHLICVVEATSSNLPNIASIDGGSCDKDTAFPRSCKAYMLAKDSINGRLRDMGKRAVYPTKVLTRNTKPTPAKCQLRNTIRNAAFAKPNL